MTEYIKIFISFLKTGLSTFGGGPAAIPLIRQEAVDNHKWLTEYEFIDALAFGNTLPGPIMTKLAAFIGYKAGGIIGSTLAVIAAVLPTAIMMIAMYTVYIKYQNEAWLKGMLKFAKPVVFVLIADVCVNMFGVFNSYQPIIIAILAGIGLYVFKFHPAVLVLSSLVIGIIVH